MRSRFLRLMFAPSLLLAVTAAPMAALAGSASVSPYAAIHQRAQQAFRALQARTPQAEAEWQSNQPGIHMLLGLDEPLLGATPALRGDGFLRANEALIGVPAAQLRAIEPSVSRQRTVLRYQQMARVGDKELRVLDGEVTLTFDNANGHLLRVVSAAMPALHIVPGALTREEAVVKAQAASAGSTFGRGNAQSAEEAVIARAQGARHVWIVHVPGASLKDLRTLAVDAQTGAVTRMPNRVMD